MSEITSHPLCWPAGWRRTPSSSRTRARFSTKRTETRHYGDGQSYTHSRQQELSINEAIGRILDELRAMGVDSWNVIISSDLVLRNDGLPRSGQATSHLDQGAAVYWRQGGRGAHRRCMAIDRYDRIADNLAAIAATLQAMRAIERHGGAEILERAFTGFAALPAPAPEEAPHQILGVDEDATQDEIEYAYRRLAQQCHPDKGGSAEQMSRINTARDAMLGGA